MKEQKSKQYFKLISKMEDFLTGSFNVVGRVWQLEKVGEHNSFSILGYMVESKIILFQCWYNGNGIHCFLPDGQMTYDGTIKQIKKMLS